MPEIADTSRTVRVVDGLDPDVYRQWSLSVLMDEDEAYEALDRIIHPDGVVCECGSSHRIGWGKSRMGCPQYRCKDCDATYTIFSGTVFSGTTLDCRRLFLLMYLMGLGCTAAQIGFEIDLTEAHVKRIMQRVHLHAKHMVQ